MWKEMTIELINYQNKTNIIKGWDDLFNKIKDNIQNLASMRMSPYYKVLLMSILLIFFCILLY